jgi:hypothetical protein
MKDLMDGVNGAILDLKDRRDHEQRRKVPLWTKTLSWAFLTFVAAGILLYVYLFAMRQTVSRQTAWFRSFVIWIVLEVAIVSSSVVMAQHVLVPLITMTEVRKIKDRVVRDILSFNAKMKRTGGVHMANKSKHRAFNAAAYLFPSHKLAALNPALKESSVISHYHTSFPKKAFKLSNSNNVKKTYDMRFALAKQAIPRIIIFLISAMIQLPAPIQDAIADVASTAAFGYLAMVFVKLFRINPLLVFLPPVTAALLVHFLTVSGKASLRLDATSVVHPASDSGSDIDEEEAKDAVKSVNTTLGAPDSAPVPISVAIGTEDAFGEQKWKSRRASAAEDLALTNSLVKRLDVRLLSRIRPMEVLTNDSNASSSDSGDGLPWELDADGNPILQWEEDGDDFDPDLEINRDMFLSAWEGEGEGGAEPSHENVERAKSSIDAICPSESDRDRNNGAADAASEKEEVTRVAVKTRGKSGENDEYSGIARRFGDLESRQARMAAIREQGHI